MISSDLTSTPRNSNERLELVELLTQPPQLVLAALRNETDALLLRTRIVTESVRTARRTSPDPAHA